MRGEEDSEDAEVDPVAQLVQVLRLETDGSPSLLLCVLPPLESRCWRALSARSEQTRPQLELHLRDDTAKIFGVAIGKSAVEHSHNALPVKNEYQAATRQPAEMLSRIFVEWRTTHL